MSYLDDVCLPLVKLLDAASFHKGAQLAGYVANLEFWVNEIRHAMDVLAGYEVRFQRLKEARSAYAAQHPQALEESAVTRSVSDAEIRKLDQQLRASSKRFLKVCCEELLVNYPKQLEIEQLLGIKVNYPRHVS